MSSVHCVVVWEWECEGQWLPHTPGVTRTLERAYDKKLTRVVLADADPALKGHYVNLRTLTQCFDTPEGGSVCCGVRRSVYDVQSPGGRGLRWEWAALAAPLRYEPMPMELQCYVEAAWGAGADSVWWRGWRVCLRRRQCLGPAGRRLLRRAPTPPYPLVHAETPKPRIPQQRTGPPALTMTPVPKVPLTPTSVPLKPASVPLTAVSVPLIPSSVPLAPASVPPGLASMAKSQAPVVPVPATSAPAPQRNGARSASPPLTRKPNLARQILHNLNIFSSGSKPADGAPQERGPRTRRHSVDTVSTYLSHGSKDSLQQWSVGELLNCSAGSDDVFETPASDSSSDSSSDDNILELEPSTGAEAEMWGVVGESGGDRERNGSEWGCVCPRCVAAIRGGRCVPAPPPPQHEKSRVSCMICGQAYGAGGAAGAGGARGEQPPGSMAWARQGPAIPAFPRCPTILVTYRFQAGVQGGSHPRPGAPYYAVGFPRHSLLPDTPLGRQVLSALVTAWEHGSLFGVAASRTTGREHVVAWRAAAPPAAPHHYPAAPARAARLLRRLLRALRAPPAPPTPPTLAAPAH